MLKIDLLRVPIASSIKWLEEEIKDLKETESDPEGGLTGYGKRHLAMTLEIKKILDGKIDPRNTIEVLKTTRSFVNGYLFLACIQKHWPTLTITDEMIGELRKYGQQLKDDFVMLWPSEMEKLLKAFGAIAN